MDLETVFKVLLVVIWIISRIASAVRKRPGAGTQAVAAAPPALEVSVANARRELRMVEVRARELLERCDERLRASVGPAFESPPGGSPLDENAALQGLLAAIDVSDRSTASRLQRLLESARRHVAALQPVLETAQSLVESRAQRTLADLYAIADAFVDDGYRPLARFAHDNRIELELGPPVALVPDLRRTVARPTSARGPSLVIVPAGVLEEPWRWFSIARQLGRHAVHTVPGLLDELAGAANLAASAEAEAGSDDTARAIVSAYLAELLGDAAAASMIGPAYLQALTVSMASPQALARVLTLRVDEWGALNPEPPAHIRVHATARWLARMGYERLARRHTDAWDMLHQAPFELRIARAAIIGTTPLEPLLSCMHEALDRIFDVRLRSLSGRRLSELPGFDDWAALGARVEQAKGALARGTEAPRGSRALLAAAIEVALQADGKAEAISRGLSQSARARPAAPVSAVPAPADASLARPRRPRGRRQLSRRKIAEALILGELVLEPASHRARR